MKLKVSKKIFMLKEAKGVEEDIGLKEVEGAKEDTS